MTQISEYGIGDLKLRLDFTMFLSTNVQLDSHARNILLRAYAIVI